jgi:hypothetical protein
VKHSDSVPTLAASVAARPGVTFDLAHGQATLGVGDTGRVVVVPAQALVQLANAAGDVATIALGHALGKELGLRASARLSGSAAVRDAAVEPVVRELATELASVGLGTFGFEQWGRALVAIVDDAPEGSDVLLGAVVETMVATATGRELVRTHKLSRDGARLRLLVANVTSVERVVAWMGEGVAWGDAITRLHSPRGADA